MDDPRLPPHDSPENDKGKKDSEKIIGFICAGGLLMLLGVALYHLAQWAVNYFHLWKW